MTGKHFAPALGVLLLLGICQARAQTPGAVERGQYLANAGNCISCHTQSGAKPFSGGVAFDTPFGTVFSSNLTQDKDTGFGAWSAADFKRAMREGVNRNGSSLIPAFPYTAFTKLSDADISDLYAYLRTIPAARFSPPSNSVLLKMRWGVSLWKALYFTEGRYSPDPLKSADWNRGAYLVQGLGHCGACHTPRNAAMAERAEAAYSGGTLTDRITPTKKGRWFAVNLTDAQQGLASWSVSDLEKFMHNGVSARAGSFGPMNEVISNSLKFLNAEDLHAMAIYLKELPGAKYSGDVVQKEFSTDGAKLYDERCKKCHAASGRGGFFTGPPLAGSAIVQGEDPSSLINITLYGPTLAKNVSYGAWESMPAYADVLSDVEIAALSNYVRGSWGNEASAINAAQVRAAR